jgi:hypothetical protein
MAFAAAEAQPCPFPIDLPAGFDIANCPPRS